MQNALQEVVTVNLQVLSQQCTDTYVYKSKGEGHPRTGHEGPEQEQMYNSTLPSTLALDGVGGQRHAPATLPPGKRPSTHRTAGWMGPRANLDRCGKSRPHQDSTPGPSSP